METFHSSNILDNPRSVYRIQDSIIRSRPFVNNRANKGRFSFVSNVLKKTARPFLPNSARCKKHKTFLIFPNFPKIAEVTVHDKKRKDKSVIAENRKQTTLINAKTGEIFVQDTQPHGEYECTTDCRDEETVEYNKEHSYLSMVSSTKQRIRKKVWNKLWEEEREMFQGPKGSFVSEAVTRHMRVQSASRLSADRNRWTEGFRGWR